MIVALEEVWRLIRQLPRWRILRRVIAQPERIAHPLGEFRNRRLRIEAAIQQVQLCECCIAKVVLQPDSLLSNLVVSRLRVSNQELI